MEKRVILPLYIRCSQIILGLLAFFYILYIGQGILIPLIFSTIIAILLNPLVGFFNRRMNRVLAISLAVLVAITCVAGIIYFIGFQLTQFGDSLPQLKQKLYDLAGQTIAWASEKFNIPPGKITEWINTTKTKQIDSGGKVIGQTLNGISGALVVLLLMPVYIFMILFYKPLLLEFIARSFSSEKQPVVTEVLHETKSLIQSYLTGLLIEAAIVTTLNSVGLLIIGIPYAILLGIISALLNIIPYIGGVISIGIAMVVALTTRSTGSAFIVMGLYLFVQILDNNFLVPKIVASKVKINALISIIVVLIGGALWGTAGMFLSIPLTAIIKVVCDRVGPLQPLGFLLGDTMPPIRKDILKPAQRDQK